MKDLIDRIERAYVAFQVKHTFPPVGMYLTTRDYDKFALFIRSHVVLHSLDPRERPTFLGLHLTARDETGLGYSFVFTKSVIPEDIVDDGHIQRKIISNFLTLKI